jgi:mono/diheme cytochrome c family protein
MRRLTIGLLGIGLLLNGTEQVLPEEQEAPQPSVTYDDDIRPILRQHCFACHNQNQAKSGLAVDSYARLIEGGSGGEVVFEQDLESSRLWTLVSHQEEPTMPPGQDKLADAKLDLIKRWIEGGLLESRGDKAKKKKKTLSLAVPATVGKPDGPAAMPENLSRELLVDTRRAGTVTALTASPWAPLAAVAGQQQIFLYHTDTAEFLGVLPYAEGVAYSLRFSRDGSMLLAGGGHHGLAGSAALYNVKTGERLVQVGDELDSVLASDVTVDLKQVALGGPRRTVRVFATESGDQVHEITKHTDWVLAVRFSPDGVLLATGDRSNGLFVWETDTGREYLDLREHSAAITDLVWSPDSNVLVSSSLDGKICLWNMHDGKLLKRWNAHAGGVEALAFAHDGRIASAGRDKKVAVWDANGKKLKELSGFSEPALQVAFSHDGQRIIAGDWSGSVRIWNLEDGKEVAQLEPKSSSVE